MSLVPCPQCGKQISDKARKCPHCNWEQTNAPKQQQPITAAPANASSQGTDTIHKKQRKLWPALLAGVGCMAIVVAALWFFVFKDKLNTNAAGQNIATEMTGKFKDFPYNTYYTGFIGSTGYMTIDRNGRGSYTYDSNGTSLTRNIEVVSYDKSSGHLLIESYNKSGEYIGVFDGYTTSDYSYSGTFTNYKGGMVEFRLLAANK
jgi:hypothetical protein